MIVIGEIAVSDTNKTVVSLDEYKGRKRLDIRDWFKKDNMKEWVRTKRGVCINITSVSNLVSLLEKAEDAILRRQA